MTELRIELTEGRLAFEPDEELNGNASWRGETAPRELELRLFWFTRGKGIEDVKIVETFRFEQPLPQETRCFRFRLPPAPYSCSGTLVSVVWALELIAYPSRTVTRQEILVGPGRKAVQLESVKTVRTGLSVQVGR